MPEPNEYQLLTNLQTTLRGMLTASGYHFSVTSAAVKFDIDADVDSLIEPDGPRPFVVIDTSEAEQWAFVEMPNGIRIVKPIRIHWVHRCALTSDQAKLQMFLRGCADIEKAIAVDSSRGGFAVRTQIVNRSMNTEADGSVVWAMVDISVSVRRTYGEPNV